MSALRSKSFACIRLLIRPDGERDQDLGLCGVQLRPEAFSARPAGSIFIGPEEVVVIAGSVIAFDFSSEFRVAIC